MITRQRALVIGAGIAGPACALFLRNAGYDVSVFEAYRRRTDVGGALAIAPNGMHILRELGLAERVQDAGSVVETMTFRTRRGRSVGVLPFRAQGPDPMPAVSLSRATLHALLLEALAERGISCAHEKRLVAIREVGDGVEAHFADGSIERGDVLIGADGIYSTVRELILPDAPKPAFTGLIGGGGFLSRSVMADLMGSASERTMTFHFGDRAFFGCALGDRREEEGAYWWYSFAQDAPLSAEQRTTLNLDPGSEISARSGHAWSAQVADIIAATQRVIAPNDIFDVSGLPRWHAGRCMLIGDAAHAVSPHSGQGASMALEDALVLARALSDEPADLKAAFRAFEATRRPRVEKVVEMGRRSGDLKRRGSIANAIQMALMPLFLRFAPSPRWLYDHDIRRAA